MLTSNIGLPSQVLSISSPAALLPPRLGSSSTSSQEVWKQRVERLFDTSLSSRPGADWKSAYDVLEPVTKYKNPFTNEVLSNELATRVLLELGYDPSAGDNWAIQLASSQGYVETVNLLLQDERVDPSTNNNYALRIASERGNYKVVRALLRDKRVDPSAEGEDALYLAVENGHSGVVDLLTSGREIDPAIIDELIEIASERGYNDVVSVLGSGQEEMM